MIPLLRYEGILSTKIKYWLSLCAGYAFLCCKWGGDNVSQKRLYNLLYVCLIGRFFSYTFCSLSQKRPFYFFFVGFLKSLFHCHIKMRPGCSRKAFLCNSRYLTGQLAKWQWLGTKLGKADDPIREISLFSSESSYY